MSFLDERAALGGKVALVLGGGGGLGRVSALDLARAGVAIELCDRDGDGVAATVADVEAAGGQAAGEVLDVRDREALTGFFGRVGARHEGRAHVVVNVVGGTFRQAFVESSPRGFDALIRTNFTWLLDAVQLSVPLLRGGGSIINLTSIEAHRAAPGFAVYGAMKAAVTSLTRTLAVELGEARIRVNAVAPDAIFTGGLEALAGRRFGPELSPERACVVPLGREGRPEDFANAVLFLASELSSYVTGTTLHPDGGVWASSGWWRWPGLGFRTEPAVEALGDAGG